MEEAQNLLSTVKLGVDLGILKELSDLQIQKLYLYIGPGNLQKYFGEQYERLDREIKRAEMIKQVINQQEVLKKQENRKKFRMNKTSNK